MARKRYSDEDALKILREIDVHLHDGLDVVSVCRKAGISDKTYYFWRKKFGNTSRHNVFISALLGFWAGEVRFLRKRKRGWHPPPPMKGAGDALSRSIAQI